MNRSVIKCKPLLSRCSTTLESSRMRQTGYGWRRSLKSYSKLKTNASTAQITLTKTRTSPPSWPGTTSAASRARPASAPPPSSPSWCPRGKRGRRKNQILNGGSNHSSSLVFPVTVLFSKVGPAPYRLHKLWELGSTTRCHLESDRAPNPASTDGELEAGARAHVPHQEGAQEAAAPEQERELEGAAGQDQAWPLTPWRAQGEDVQLDESPRQRADHGPHQSWSTSARPDCQVSETLNLGHGTCYHLLLPGARPTTKQLTRRESWPQLKRRRRAQESWRRMSPLGSMWQCTGSQKVRSYQGELIFFQGEGSEKSSEEMEIGEECSTALHDWHSAALSGNYSRRLK